MRVIEKKNEKNQEKIVWGPNVQDVEKWNKWEVNMMTDDKRTIALLPQSKQENDRDFGVLAECKGNNWVYSWQNSQGISKKFVEVVNGQINTGPKFKLDKCQREDNKETWDIKFEEIFEWEGTFQPKIIFIVENK